ncbi:MAG: galactose mutarotase [Alphaproteobacteria bacterium]|nr:galactose mutarotase [Alphaproteobacteria bacterium]
MENFGTVGGTPVHKLALRGPGVAAEILTYGATLRALHVDTPRGTVNVALGHEDLAGYLAEKGYVGAIVGRYANRIGGSQFTLDGTVHRVVPNEGDNQLHGGPGGFSTRVWRIVSATSTRVELALTSPDGEMGYPGTLEAMAIYEIPAPGTLRITTQATADKPTPANIVSHAYYNLDGGGDVRDHELHIAAGRIVAVDKALIPTGDTPSVTDTPFDFRKSKRLRDGGVHYDVNFCLDRAGEGLFLGAVLKGAKSGLAMEVHTSEPGIQLYDGKFLAAPFAAHGGLCLECQLYPDAPNRPSFPDAILRPGKRLTQIVELRFKT